jgi:hypothetical protein
MYGPWLKEYQQLLITEGRWGGRLRRNESIRRVLPKIGFPPNPAIRAGARHQRRQTKTRSSAASRIMQEN